MKGKRDDILLSKSEEKISMGKKALKAKSLDELSTKAAKYIINGDLVIFPTETVYGIGADSSNDSACKAIFAIKGRPSYNPLILHFFCIGDIKRYAYINSRFTKLSSLWPGPLTLIVKKRRDAMLSKIATAGLDTIAVRIPSYDIALEIIKKSKIPIAAPSANKSGYVSPTKYNHVKNFENVKKIFPIDGGICNVGIESTIVDISCKETRILRTGYYTKDKIENILNEKILENINQKDDNKIIAPGMMSKHYSPVTKLRINASTLNHDEIGLGFGNNNLNSEFNLSVTGCLEEAARNLYDMIRMLDNHCMHHAIKQIAVASIPNFGIGTAINDRLIRASLN